MYDALSALSDVLHVIGIGVVAFAALRGVQIGRALVNPEFRNRAYWTSLIAVMFVGTNLLDYVPFFVSPDSGNTVAGAFLSSLPWQILFMGIFGFIDSTIMVTVRMDFFHRNTFRWGTVRKPLAAAYLVFVVILYTLTSYSPYANEAPLWAVALVYLGIVVVIGSLVISVPVLLIGARRTPDRTMKRFVTYLALTFGVYLIVAAGIDSFLPSASIVSRSVGLVGAYLLYRTVMSLSPIGRVEKGSKADPAASGVRSA